MRRWRRVKWHSCGGLWIKDESFDLAPSFLSPVAHLNYYKGGLEENRVSKVHTKEELMWERSRKFFIFNTWRTMTDTSESNRVPKHKVTSQYAEAQPTFHAVLSRKKKRSSVMAHLNQSCLESNGLFQHTKLSVRAVFKGRKTWFSPFFLTTLVLLQAIIHFHLWLIFSRKFRMEQYWLDLYVFIDFCVHTKMLSFVVWEDAVHCNLSK